MTDSRSERPIPTEPADPQAMTRRDPQDAASDSPGYDPTGAVPGTGIPTQPTWPSVYAPAPPAARAQPRMPTSSQAASQATATGSTASARPFVWDGGLISEDDGPGAPPASPAAERAQAGPAESKRSSLRRLQWIGGAADENAADGGGDGGAPGDPPEGPEGGSRGRGSRVGLVFVGALAVAGLLVWAITSTLPKSGPKAAVAAAGTASASPTHPLQPLGASPIAVLSDTAAPSPSATRITLPAAPHTTVSQHPATVKTAATTKAPASTAPAASPPPTADVQIADSANGLALDVDNSGTTSGTLVGTWAVDGTPAQHWHLVAQPNGGYVIYSELADLKEGLEINTDANDFSGDTVTTLQSYTDDTSMQWTAKYLGSNKYELVSGYNGQCLTGGGQGVANATITCDTSDTHQAWTITG